MEPGERITQEGLDLSFCSTQLGESKIFSRWSLYKFKHHHHLLYIARRLKKLWQLVSTCTRHDTSELSTVDGYLECKWLLLRSC